MYRIDGRTGALTVAIDDMARPNGLAFSPDESKLYVVDTPAEPKTTHAYDIVDDGTRAVNGRVFFDTKGWADGIRVDTEGNVWCGFSGGEGEDGVAVFAPDGKLIGRILLPSVVPMSASAGRSETGCSWRQASRFTRCMSRHRACGEANGQPTNALARNGKLSSIR